MQQTQLSGSFSPRLAKDAAVVVHAMSCTVHLTRILFRHLLRRTFGAVIGPAAGSARALHMVVVGVAHTHPVVVAGHLPGDMGVVATHADHLAQYTDSAAAPQTTLAGLLGRTTETGAQETGAGAAELGHSKWEAGGCSGMSCVIECDRSSSFTGQLEVMGERTVEAVK